MNTNISWDFQICISVPLRFYKTKPYKWLQKAFRWCFCGLYNNTLLGFLRNISDFLEKVLWQVGPHVGYFLPVFMKFYPLTTTNFSQMSWNFYQASILSRQTNKSDLKNRSRGGSRAAAAILDPPLRSGHSLTHEAVSFLTFIFLVISRNFQVRFNPNTAWNLRFCPYTGEYR